MGAPTSPTYPTSYDTDSSLLGLPGNRQLFRVAALVTVDDTLIQVDKDASGIDLPAYVVFAGGEIIYITSVGGAGNKVLNCETLSNRGQLGTPIQVHGLNERIYVSILSANHNLMRTAIMLAQKYHGLVGADSSKPATCSPGERYVATDTGSIYYCFATDSWTRVNYGDHADLLGLSDDDHSQYHTDGRADTWHGLEPGVHIPGGDDHDHYSSGEGSAATRFAGGLENNKPATPVSGQVWYSTDLDGGTLWIAVGTEWIKVGSVPQDGILPFSLDACPSGWSRFAAGNDNYLRNNTVANALLTGGSHTHSHTIEENREHYHVVNSQGGGVSGGGASGDHSINTGHNAGGGENRMGHSNLANGGGSSTDDGAHGHTITIPSHYTEYSGSASPSTASSDGRPASRRVLWCQKD